MKKNTVIKVLIASIIAIGVGLTITFVSYFSGANVAISQLRFGPFNVIRWDSEASESYGHNETYTAQSKITKLKLDADMGDVTIQKGNEFSIRCENIPTRLISVNESNDEFSFSLKNDTLNIPFTNDYEIIVTLPEHIQYVSADLNLGSLDITNVSLKQLHIAMDVGDLDIENSVADEIQLLMHLGDLDFEGDVNNKLIVENDAGDVDLQLLKAENNYNFDLAVDLGNLELDDHNVGSLNASYKRDNNQSTLVKAKVNLGDLNISFGYDD